MATRDDDAVGMNAASKWAFVRTILLCAFNGAVYGMAVGAAVASREGAALAVGIGGGVLALVGAVVGFRFGHTRGFVGTVGAFAGGVIGAYLGAVVVAVPESIYGGLAGFIVGKVVARKAPRLLTSFGGTFLGASEGAIIGMFLRNPTDAIVGIGWGRSQGPLRESPRSFCSSRCRTCFTAIASRWHGEGCPRTIRRFRATTRSEDQRSLPSPARGNPPHGGRLLR